ncbi:Leucine Rich repeats (2 copies) [Anatilimnocola aggregata]|uniref:Leucine Rich repeats (2 copies) n=1 Tax=Anatilimnocola aggregata TaxID=2528021 RepID=A0A517Y9Z3_9BACT|nr:hypothetical protein [Anatilimnocola aggregata]QDU27050.1 Leucine Rich repeats (2 copies) [Anatilimnocola aggregata]
MMSLRLIGVLLLFDCGLAAAQKANYQPAKTAEEALARIESLGGCVRYLSRGSDLLEVDFQFAGDRVRDEHLQDLLVLPHVAVLRLKQTAITDIGLIHVAKLPKLLRLQLDETAITDAGLTHLKPLEDLESLQLYRTKVTDSGLKHLAELPKLKLLLVGDTVVTARAVHELTQSKPQLTVIPNRAVDLVRAEIIERTSISLLEDARTALAIVQFDLDELAPHQEYLKQFEEVTRKQAESTKAAAEDLKRKRDEANKLASDAERTAQEALKQSSVKPDDANLGKQAEAKQQAATTAKTTADQAQSAYADAQQIAEEAKVEADTIRQLHDRARNAKKKLEIAQRIVAGSQQRVMDAQRLIDNSK